VKSKKRKNKTKNRSSYFLGNIMVFKKFGKIAKDRLIIGVSSVA
jgi:hypothetical protein